jgi:DNA-binding CsgD family transcriptional regulator
MLRRLVPHIRRAGQLSLRLASAHQGGMLDAFDIFDCGAILLDWQGRVLRVNAKAEALMGPWLTVRAGFLNAGRQDCDSALQKLIASVIARGPLHEADPIGAIAIERPKARPLLVHGAPMAKSARDLFQQARAALMLVDPDEHQAPQEAFLRQIFGFTNAEAAIAAALACGQDIDEIAQARGVRPATIRNQIKGIFAKTDTRRQAELVALLLRSSAPR